MPDYEHKRVEKKWRSRWKEQGTYRVTEDASKPKYYVLDMFPYPSGAGLHVGHPLGYIASDIFARYKRHSGFNVLHPMGFDAFGLPAEQYALSRGIHPAASTTENIERYRQQFESLGFSYDWERQVSTCDPTYYKWTQWIFTKLFHHYYDVNEEKAKPITALTSIFERDGNASASAFSEYKETFSGADWLAYTDKEKAEILMHYRLAYRDVGYVNWCEELGTVLANDQVKDGLSERGGYPVVRKAMTQWYLRITSYADRMLTGLDQIDWSDSLKAIQRNWIGRSEGATVFFQIEGHADRLEIYTTRPDTIFGATFMVLAPEHGLVTQITTSEQQTAIDEYRSYVKTRSEIERMADVKNVTGAFTGAYAYNPITKKNIPIWISEYVLLDYGTGAIMAVPSDDERDEKFAEKFGLEIIPVVDKTKYPDATLHDKLGVLINSDFLNGMEVPEAIVAATSRIEQMGLGHKKVNYKMRDSNFSRQRYWGEPFPVVYDENDIAYTIDLQDLPVALPHSDDFEPTADGKSPLAKLTDWVKRDDGMLRETDTMPAVAGSSWYFLRYMDPNNPDVFADRKKIDYWQDVDLYIGGVEHAVAHLMYARFWQKFLFDLELVPTEEPFRKLVNQGMIQGVIEYVLLQKEKVDGRHRFVSADMAEEDTKYARLPLPIQFVEDYGSENSYLTEAGIAKFIDWSSGYETAEFLTREGSFSPGHSEGRVRFQTISEVGKMSKSKFNVINPDDVTDRYGTDCFRLYEMFLGPLQNSKPWDTNGIDGVYKFIKKLWQLFYNDAGDEIITDEKPSADELKVLHATIKKISGDIERLSFNTCVSHFMVLVNELRALKCTKRAILEPLTILIAPFAPFLTEELWEALGKQGSVHHAAYPLCDESHLVEAELTLPVAINGKKRTEATFSADASKDEIEQIALALDVVQKWTEGKQIKKVIVVPGRMINVVV